MKDWQEREKKTRQTAVKYAPSFEERMVRATRSRHIPRSRIFLEMAELAVDFSEMTGMRLEDVPAKIRKICADSINDEPTVSQQQVEPETRSDMGRTKRPTAPTKPPPVLLQDSNDSSGARLSDELYETLGDNKMEEGNNAKA